MRPHVSQKIFQIQEKYPEVYASSSAVSVNMMTAHITLLYSEYLTHVYTHRNQISSSGVCENGKAGMLNQIDLNQIE